MKKTLCFFIALCACLCIASCGKKEEKLIEETGAYTDVEGAVIDFEAETYDTMTVDAVDVAEGEENESETKAEETEKSGMSIDIPSFELEPIKPVTVNDITIEFEPIVPEFNFDIKTYEISEPAVIDFTPAEFELDIKNNITKEDQAKIDDLDEAEMNEIANKKANLIYDLVVAFKAAGIDVTFNDVTGEMNADATVLFGGDSAVLTDKGKAFLDKFTSAYSSVVFSDKYEGFVSKILVEGHIAPISGSTYESGLPLSQERADNVKNYWMSVDTAHTADLKDTLTSVGQSNKAPVKDANGKVDMAASRRVGFRFLVNLD